VLSCWIDFALKVKVAPVQVAERTVRFLIGTIETDFLHKSFSCKGVRLLPFALMIIRPRALGRVAACRFFGFIVLPLEKNLTDLIEREL
jgi:hypothetical protein